MFYKKKYVLLIAITASAPYHGAAELISKKFLYD